MSIFDKNIRHDVGSKTIENIEILKYSKYCIHKSYSCCKKYVHSGSTFLQYYVCKPCMESFMTYESLVPLPMA